MAFKYRVIEIKFENIGRGRRVRSTAATYSRYYQYPSRAKKIPLRCDAWKWKQSRLDGAGCGFDEIIFIDRPPHFCFLTVVKLDLVRIT